MIVCKKRNDIKLWHKRSGCLHELSNGTIIPSYHYVCALHKVLLATALQDDIHHTEVTERANMITLMNAMIQLKSNQHTSACNPSNPPNCHPTT